MTREVLMDWAKNERLEAFDRSIDVHISRVALAHQPPRSSQKSLIFNDFDAPSPAAHNGLVAGSSPAGQSDANRSFPVSDE
jgi:hypothetical protein